MNKIMINSSLVASKADINSWFSKGAIFIAALAVPLLVSKDTARAASVSFSFNGDPTGILEFLPEEFSEDGTVPIAVSASGNLETFFTTDADGGDITQTIEIGGLDFTDPSKTQSQTFTDPFTEVSDSLSHSVFDTFDLGEGTYTVTGTPTVSFNPSDPDFVAPEPQSFSFTVEKVPEPLTILGSGLALGFGAYFKKEYARKQKKAKAKA